ncbi:MAG: dihydroorotase [Proteobacteria bacterium]|nr:dihydroorotase [Pseudomonadota bacterium]
MIADKLIITRPDDWHLHLRDGRMMATVLADTAYRFKRAIIMPNLTPPVTTLAAALSYRERILAALPAGMDFEPLMTLYLTDHTSIDEVKQAFESRKVYGVKLYPAGATTHSDAGVTSIKRVYTVLEAMQKIGMPLLVHGEVTDSETDIFDREKIFLERVLTPVIKDFPALKIVLEHITTLDAVQFVMEASPHVGATITPHHLMLNRNALFSGGLRPHHYCLPVLKREAHRLALIQAATSGNPKFFLGTDSAPHSRQAKEASCGCAGIYTAHAAIELYAEIFDLAHALDKLEAFSSFFGADFYGLPRNTGQITLVRKKQAVPSEILSGHEVVIPFWANETLSWSFLPV